MKSSGGVVGSPTGIGTSTATWTRPPAAGFCHQALHYRGRDDLVRSLVPFVLHGIALGEAVLVMVPGATLSRLHRTLGPVAGTVELADMDEIGANPARIIPAWESFVERHAGAGHLRGVGEPIGPDRSGPALSEAEHHEDLLNVAFESTTPMWLLCPYDVTALSPEVVRRSMRNHAFTCDGEAHRASDAYRGRQVLGRPAAGPLAAVPPHASRLVVDGPAALAAARALVSERAGVAGMAGRAADAVLAADEVLVNSLRHGGGRAEAAVWVETGALHCRVVDRGQLDDPLAGRRRPLPSATGGRGLWIANQLSDLVQVRSMPGSTVVQLTWSPRR